MHTHTHRVHTQTQTHIHRGNGFLPSRKANRIHGTSNLKQIGLYCFHPEKKLKLSSVGFQIHTFITTLQASQNAIPSTYTRTTYVPKLFDINFSALKGVLLDEYVNIIADETTDVRDHSILSIIASVRGRSFLIGVVKTASVSCW